MKERSPISKLVWWIQSGFNFNFRFKFEYRIHHTIKGDAFEWILGYLNASFEMTFLREITHKALHNKKFCAGPDDPAKQCPAVWSKSGWSGPRPDDPDLVICGRPGEGQAGWSRPENFSVCLAFSVTTPDDPRLPRMIRVPPENTQRSLSGWEYIYPFTPFIYFSLSLPDQSRLQNIKSSTSLHPRVWFLQGNT